MCQAAHVVTAADGTLSTSTWYQYNSGSSPQEVEPPPADELGVEPGIYPDDDPREGEGSPSVVVDPAAGWVRRFFFRLGGSRFEKGRRRMYLGSDKLLPIVERPRLPAGSILIGKTFRVTDQHRKGCLDGHILDGIPRQHRGSFVYDEAADVFGVISESIAPASGRPDTWDVKSSTHIPVDRETGVYDLLDDVGSHALLKGVPMLLYGQLDECVVVRASSAAGEVLPTAGERFCPKVPPAIRRAVFEAIGDCAAQAAVCRRTHVAYERFLGPPPALGLLPSELDVADEPAEVEAGVEATNVTEGAFADALKLCVPGRSCWRDVLRHVRHELAIHHDANAVAKWRTRLGAPAHYAQDRPLWCAVACRSPRVHTSPSPHAPRPCPRPPRALPSLPHLPAILHELV